MSILNITLIFLSSTLITFSNYQIDKWESKDCFLDISINSIEIGKDLTPVLGLEKLDNCEPNCRKVFYNKDKTEMLELFFYPGRVMNHCSYIRVTKIDSLSLREDPDILKDKNFISGLGINLTSSYQEIISLFDKESISIQEKKHLTFITYYGFMQEKSDCITSLENDDFTHYKSEYVFSNNLLISFEFGFVYP